MAQVMVNFRMDETVKKNMEQACREMGLSMTTAFTIFATKVGKEKRIPFEITAEPHGLSSCGRRYGPAESSPAHGEETSLLARKQERLETLCAEIRRSVTAIHTAIPSSITGLSMERIRLLCGDELKDKAAGASNAVKNVFSSRNAGILPEKDLSILEEYLEGLASIATDMREIEHTLVPAMKAWSGGDTGGFDSYEQRLTGISRAFDGLRDVMQRFLRSTARRQASGRAVQAQIQQAALAVKTPYVLTALESLGTQILRHYDALDGGTKARLESYYLRTLELTLRELGQAEQNGGDAGTKAALCLRSVNVITQVIAGNTQAQAELNGRNLEAEVEAMERFAAMRGDIADGVGPEL